jgi:CPA1 family monovalent cation:H+ antiporter
MPSDDEEADDDRPDHGGMTSDDLGSVAGLTLNVAWLFVGLLALATLVALVTRRTRLPWSIGLLIAGLAIGVVIPGVEVAITPELLLAILLPGLVFEAALRIDARELRGTIVAVSVLAGPGVLISALVVALALHWFTGIALDSAFLVGAIVAATDPAAVVSVFGHIGGPRRLATTVEAESLFNDGTGIVLFAIALSAVQGGLDPGAGLVSFVVTVVVSTILGIAFGFATTLLMGRVDDHLIELSLSLIAAYGTYLIALQFHESGIIATVVAGIVIGTVGRRYGMSSRTRGALDTVWEFIAYLLTALTFLLMGLAIPFEQLAAAALPILVGFAATLVARAVLVYGVVGGGGRLLRRPAVPIGWLHVLAWAGLRGAVATALALSVPRDLPDAQLLSGVAFGIVILTLVIQGTTAESVIRRALWGGPPSSPQDAAAPAGPSGEATPPTSG